jgi:hypothetical protein
MAQLTIYLDDETEERMKQAAAEAGVSRSRWVAGVIRERTASEWPQPVRRLAGAWKDFPEVVELRTDLGEDAPRQPL